MFEKMKRKLTGLDDYEAIGKMHVSKYGKNLSDLQLIYLSQRKSSITTLADLYSNEALMEQKRIQYSLRHGEHTAVLRSDQFLSDEKNIEIEKLLRYVDITPHQHDFFECAYVVCGKCQNYINGQTFWLKPGNFVTIPLQHTHTLIPDEDCLCLTIKIRSETFEDLNFPGLANFLFALTFHCSQDTFVQNTIASIWDQQIENRPYCDQIIEQQFKTLMFYLVQNYSDNMEFLLSNHTISHKMAEIFSFMMDNYKTITLKSVAAQFHYHPAYFSRLFHKETGRAFSDIVKEYKIRQAAKILASHSDKHIGDVCEEVGYSDPTQFIRSFKEIYGVTPGRYRANQNHSSQI